MESIQSMPPQQIQIYHYQPDSDARHNGMFTPHPQDQPIYGALPMHGYQQVPSHYYPAPHWQHTPPQYAPQAHYAHPHQGRVMTPRASPPLMLATPKIVVDQHPSMMHHLDTGFMIERNSPTPPTPSLSACPSTVSSPPASNYHTPVHGGYFGFNLPIEAQKDDLHIPFADLEWASQDGSNRELSLARLEGENAQLAT
jgi:hypothetical protein